MTLIYLSILFIFHLFYQYIYIRLIDFFDFRLSSPKKSSLILSLISGSGIFTLVAYTITTEFTIDLPTILKILLVSMTFLYPFIVFAIAFRKMTPILFVFSNIFLISYNFFSGLKNTIFFYVNISFSYVVRYIITISINVIVISFIIFVCKRKNNTEVIRDAFLKVPKKTYVLLIITGWILTVYTNLFNLDYRVLRAFLAFLVIILTIIIIVFILMIAIKSKEQEETKSILEKQLTNQVKYYEKINSIYSEFRSFRHDFKNHILCLRYILEDNDIPQALKYLDDMFDISSVNRNQYNTGNIIIDSLLSDKNDKALDYNTVLVFDGIVPSNGISSIDLCTIFANAIDNAIEACAKSDDDTQKEIKITSAIKQGYYFLNISNPIFDKINIQNNVIITSKKDKEHHGFGVSNITKTSRKYNGSTTVKVEDEHFILDVEILLDMQIIEDR